MFQHRSKSVRNGSGRVLAALGLAWLVTTAAAAVPNAAPTGAAAGEEFEPAVLRIANRPIYTMRAGGYAGAPPRERARVVQDNVRAMVALGGPLAVSTQEIPEGVAVLVDDRLAFRVLKDDVSPEGGETPQSVAAQASRNLAMAIGELREASDASALLPAVGFALLATVILAVLLWLVIRLYRWAHKQVSVHVQRRFARSLPHWAGQVLGEATVAGLFHLPLKLLAFVALALLSYEWVAYVLHLFPYTRPWGEALLRNLLDALGGFGAGMLRAIPGLLFVALIIFITRIVVRVVRAFFDGVQTGDIRLGLLDDATARPTGRLVVAAIWLFALVAAYPYIPGSDSEAFKGIGVFVGLMMSIGASGVVNQAVSGLMLMYTRALRPGEFVQIGEIEGTVRSVGFVTTRIETLRHEEINIPNAIIVGNVTRNYSRLAHDGGLWVATKVTIGYDTPWRQVHAMLELAAARTEGVVKEHAPRVRQTALHDFYVEYTLLVNIAVPEQRITLLDRLHANILDAFNEFGVQIMSPNYEADPEGPKVVPREKWFEPPAAR